MYPTDETAEGQVIYIESVSIHPKYSYRQSYQDVAVIKLKENANLTAWVHPICVPEEGHNDPNKWERQSVDVIGYAYSGFTVNNNLKETDGNKKPIIIKTVVSSMNSSKLPEIIKF